MVRAVKQFGDNNWSIVASVVGGRSKRQCSERWKKFLCPTINVSTWTAEEDELLLEKYKEYGPKWTFMIRFFNNRTDISIKTRYTILQRRMKKKQDFLEKIQFIKDFSKTKEKQKIQDDILYIDLFDKQNETPQGISNENFLIDFSKTYENDIWPEIDQKIFFF